MAHILIVDDEESIVTLLQRILESRGHMVSTASCSAHALNTLPEEGVDLVVTDIVMPDMNGIELITVLLKKFPGLKIIAISGGCEKRGPMDYLQMALNRGASRCMAKPFMLSELVTMVNSLLPKQGKTLPIQDEQNSPT